MRVFTAWGGEGDLFATTVISGEGPPRFANGTLMEECEQFFWRIEVGSFEEALAIHHLRRGWERFQPVGGAAPCRGCGSLHYTLDSGECWRCGQKW